MSVASCERSFSQLKLVKFYLRSSISDSRLSNLATLSIERSKAESLDYEKIISSFAVLKARKFHTFCIFHKMNKQ